MNSVKNLQQNLVSPVFANFVKAYITKNVTKIIPSLGYIPGNIIVMSKKANTLKSNGTLEEHKKLVKWMEEQKL